MAFIPADKGIEAVLQYELLSQRCITTLWFKANSDPELTELESVRTLAKAWWDNIKLGLSADLKLETIQVYDRTSAVGLYIEDSSIGGPNGLVDEPSVSSNVAFRVGFQTGYTGRSSRGANYLLGLPVTYVTGNTVAGAFQTYVRLAYEELRDDAALEALPWCVCSRYHNGAPRTLGVMVPIIDISYNSHVADMGRRVPGHGD